MTSNSVHGSENSDSFDRDLFQPLVGELLWAPRIGLLAMTGFLIGALFVSPSRGVALLLPIVVLIWLVFEIAIRVYRHCRREIRSRGSLVAATIVQKRIALRGGLRVISVEFDRNGEIQRSSVYVSSSTFHTLDVGQRLEARYLPVGPCRIISPVPVRRLT
jgi:hypothetical protein